MIKNKEPINLFWTGGWDSTFRLLQLVIVYKKRVQPFYVIDQGRNSTLMEIRAMTQIKTLISEKFPKVKNSILPTHFKNLNDIKPDPGISKSYSVLKAQIPIGIQYEWLALFCNEQRITDIEFSLEQRINKNENIIINLIGNDMCKIESEQGIYYRVNKNSKGRDIYSLFGNMIFPIFDITKLQMFEMSIKFGFDEILKQTWFCLTPTIYSNPCGKCSPCRSVVSEGLNWRLPFNSKMRYYLWPPLRKIAKAFRIKY